MTSRRVLPALLLLFVGSGCAALIYEIVWSQLLQLVIGSSAVSLGLLLAAYMGGLCFGSALLPRVGVRFVLQFGQHLLLRLGPRREGEGRHRRFLFRGHGPPLADDAEHSKP